MKFNFSILLTVTGVDNLVKICSEDVSYCSMFKTINKLIKPMVLFITYSFYSVIYINVLCSVLCDQSSNMFQLEWYSYMIKC